MVITTCTLATIKLCSDFILIGEIYTNVHSFKSIKIHVKA